MTRPALLALIPALFLSGTPLLADEQAGIESMVFTETSACMEGPMAQFGRYIGQWNIEDSAYQKEDGSWQPGPGARWDFLCLGNGTAIQDFWMPNDGGTGSNLRTYNTETESWDIAWTMTGLSGFAHITARQADDGSIVMHYKAPLPNPLRQITFFPPKDDSWNWKLEFSMDGGENWFEVYRIKATRL